MKKPKIFSNIKTKKELKRTARILIVLFIICASVPLIINLYVISYASQYILSVEECDSTATDCVMVLGAGVYGDDPSDMLEERLNKGLAVYNTNCTDRLLMSGDHGRTEYDEVNTMKDYAVNAGAVPDKVFMDHAGFSTYESMYRARDVFEVKSMVIVTQKYHLYRAIFNARKLGIEAYGVAADGQYRYPVTTVFFNNARESLARCKDFVYCIYKPLPTYLGDVIPINSSGVLTDDKKE